MRITKVEAQNLKGRTFQYELSPAVAIVGDNFTGKTAIIDAIRLALMGYIPELGKTNAATWQLSSGDEMGIVVTMDNGKLYGHHQWLEKGRLKIAVPPQETMIVPLLNASAYFAMTERERYDYVFKIAKMPEEFTVEAIIGECERLSFEEAHTEQIVFAKQNVISELMLAPIQRESVQHFLTERVERLKGMFTIWNARAKDTQGAVRVLTELKAKEATRSVPISQLEKDVDLLDKKVDELRAATTALMAKRDQAIALRECKARYDKLKAAVQSTEERDKLQKNIEETEAAMPPKGAEISEVELKAKREAAGKLLADYGALGLQLTAIEKRGDELKELLFCPFCQASEKGWKENLANFIGNEWKLVKAQIETTKQGLDTAVAERDMMEAEAKRIRANNELVKEQQQKILMWQQRIDDYRKKQQQWEDALAHEKAELDKLPETAEPSEEDINLAAALAEKATIDRGQARQTLQEAQRLEHDIKRAAQSEQEHLKAKAMVVCIKKIGDILRDKKAALVDLVFNDLLHVANAIVGELLVSDLAFHEGEVGRWNGHRWISHKTFTGAEQALTFVAIAAALSQQSPLKLLIFDELGRLDVTNRVEIIRELFAAVGDGWLDQFIVAGAVHLPGMVGLQLIDLNVSKELH